mgnify:CR=1 FL=1
MENKTLIFCQANADLLYTLDLIQKNNNVIVYVINVKGIYDYLLSLKIKGVEVKFQPYFVFSLYKPKSIFQAKNQLKTFWNKEFSTCKNCKVYFFSTSYDWLTATCVKQLSKNNCVTYYNHYDHLTSLVGQNSFSFKRKIMKLVYKFITGVDFLAFTKVNFPKFNYKKYKIAKYDIIEKPNVNKEFLYSFKGETKNVLFFISPGEIEKLTDSSKELLFTMLNNIKRTGVSVVLKGHPRLGEPDEIKPFVDFVIPKNVPSEFINYENFDFAFGLTSAALCYPAQKNLCVVYSLVKILEFIDAVKQVEFENYIRKYSGDKIVFSSEKINALLNKNL